jgi:hypothetical protein
LGYHAKKRKKEWEKWRCAKEEKEIKNRLMCIKQEEGVKKCPCTKRRK